jgi:predicted nucleotidyltransferase
MDWKEFSKKFADALGDNLVGIHLFGSVATDEMIPTYSDRDINLVLNRKDEKALRKLKTVGAFFKDETGQDCLVPHSVDELKELAPLSKLTYIKHTKAIYGKAAADLIEMPRKEELSKSLIEYIRYEIKPYTMEVLASFKFWNERDRKSRSYRVLKRAALVMSVCYFIQTGKYLASRKQLRSKGDPDLALVCDILDKYPSATLEEIEKALWAALSILLRVEKDLVK